MGGGGGDILEGGWVGEWVGVGGGGGCLYGEVDRADTNHSFCLSISHSVVNGVKDYNRRLIHHSSSIPTTPSMKGCTLVTNLQMEAVSKAVKTGAGESRAAIR